MRNNMITKKLIKFALLFFLIGLTACDNKLNPGFDPDDYEPIVPPEPVRTMDAMASGERVVLSGASLTDIVLKWTPTEKHGNTVYRYEVLIDTIGGDFTKPVETIFSDNNGLESQLTLTHYQANTIGKLAKFRCNTNGTLRWKVRAYCGLDQALSSLEGYFVIFMMDGIDDMPSENEPVYITGVGTEDDGDEAEAQQMLRQNEGIYQTFTQLKADQPFIFMSTVEGRKCYYYVDDNGNRVETQCPLLSEWRGGLTELGDTSEPLLAEAIARITTGTSRVKKAAKTVKSSQGAIRVPKLSHNEHLQRIIIDQDKFSTLNKSK